MRSARILLLATLLLGACSGPQPSQPTLSMAAAATAARAQALTRAPSPRPSPSATRTPSATPTPSPPLNPDLALQSYRELHARLARLQETGLRPSQGEAIPPGAELVLLPLRESLWYAQTVLHPDAAVMTPAPASRLWLTYDYVRETELTYMIAMNASVTKDLGVTLALMLEDVAAGTIRPVATWSATAGPGSESVADMVQDVLQALRDDKPQLYPPGQALGDVISLAVDGPSGEAWAKLGWAQQHAILAALLEGTNDWADQRSLIRRMGALLLDRPNDDMLAASVALMLTSSEGDGKLDDTRRTALDSLGQPGLDATYRVLAHPDKFIAERACAFASACSYVPSDEADYAKWLGFEWQGRAMAAYHLAQQTKPVVGLTSTLVEMTQAQDATLRALAFAALAVGKPGEQVVARAIDALDDPDPWVRAHAALLLATGAVYQQPVQARLLEVAAQDPDPLVRTRALLALSKAKPTEAIVQALIAALERERGRDLLSVLEAAQNLGPAASAAAPALAKLLQDPDYVLVFTAATTLGMMGRAAGAAAPALAEAWCRTGLPPLQDYLAQVTGVRYASCADARALAPTVAAARVRETVAPAAAKIAPGVKVGMAFFKEPGCVPCQEALVEVVRPLVAEYGNQVAPAEFDVSTPAGQETLRYLEEQFAVTVSLLPTIFIGQDVLIGAEEIRARLAGLVEHYAELGGTDWPTAPLPNLARETPTQR